MSLQMCLVAVLLSMKLLCAFAIGTFTAVGPKGAIFVSYGEDAVLPCHLIPPLSAQKMAVRWFRSQYHSVVHLYRDGKDQEGVQMPQFQQRTVLRKHDLTSGRVELKIRSVTPSDAGSYTCFFQSLWFYDSAQLELVVTGFGSIPHIHIDHYDDGGIRVACKSSGWYPEPEAMWQDVNKKSLPPLSETWAADEDGLFYGAINIVMKSKSHQNVSCLMRNRLTQQEHVVHISTAEIIPAKRNRVEVLMDHNTAHPELHISNDSKTVTCGARQTDLPDYPERFDTRLCVLGSERYSSGKHYWEIEVDNSPGWTVGVVQSTIERKERIELSPNEGKWLLQLKGGIYTALTSPPTPLAIKKKPKKIGVYLDYESSKVLFFNAETLDNIYTCWHSFSGQKLYPFFSLWSSGDKITVC
ncbi:butyrophilin subfamily 1 member A1-like isoform X2 [Lissotriton helveticus]